MGCLRQLQTVWAGIIGVIVGRGTVLRVQSSLEWLVCTRAAGLAATVPILRVGGSAS